MKKYRIRFWKNSSLPKKELKDLRQTLAYADWSGEATDLVDVIGRSQMLDVSGSILIETVEP